MRRSLPDRPRLGTNRTLLFRRPCRDLDAGIDVYVPPGYVAESEAPFIVLGDSGAHGFSNEKQFFTILDNLISQHRVPPMAAISIGAGGQDAQGSERGLEYDAVTGAYAEFVENEVLPLAEKNANIKLTKNLRAERRWASARAVRRPSRWLGSIPNSTIECWHTRRPW